EVRGVPRQVRAGSGRAAEEAAHERLGGYDDVGDHFAGLELLRRESVREPPEQLEVAPLALIVGPSGEVGVSRGGQEVKPVLHGPSAHPGIRLDMEGAVAVVRDPAPGREEGGALPGAGAA